MLHHRLASLVHFSGFVATIVGAWLVALPSAHAAVPGRQGIEIEGAMDRRGLYVGVGVGAGGAVIENHEAFGYSQIDFLLGGGVTKRLTLGVDLRLQPFFQSKPAVGFGGDLELTGFVWKGLFARLGAGALGYSHSPYRRDSGVVGAFGGRAGIGYEFFVNATAAMSFEANYDLRAVPDHGFNQAGFVGFRIIWY